MLVDLICGAECGNELSSLVLIASDFQRVALPISVKLNNEGQSGASNPCSEEIAEIS
jgi:hypothetical protein